MIQIIADNIISGLGKTTAENLEAIRQGRSALRQSADFRISGGGPVMVSQMPDSYMDPLLNSTNLTRLEKFMVTSVEAVCNDLGEDILKDKSTLFVFSTTKGNIEYLGRDDSKVPLWHSARVVAEHFGNPNEPLTVSNACISGVAAIIVAKRLLESNLYKTAVIVGADSLSEFVVSGFDSLKSLSTERCRPFDENRNGLNLGEAVCTMVLKRVGSAEDVFPAGNCFKTPQAVTSGAISNDANHISTPAMNAEGLYRAIARTLGFGYGKKTEISADEAFINLHGTATLYNDQMESVAISRSGLSNLDVVPLKGYYGHTLGASGVLETILSCHFLDEGWLPAAAGYESEGCYPAPQISTEIRHTEASWFLKTISGFGGSNAAIRVEKINPANFKEEKAGVDICPEAAFNIEYRGNVKEYLDSLYREDKIDYPKFHKMDLIGKAGIIAARHLSSLPDDENTALVLMNASSSLSADTEYLATVAEDDFFPSPKIFVYTLPSVVIGEISIRHKLYGEGIFFVQKAFNRKMAMDYIKCLFAEGAAKRAVLCWIEVTPDCCTLNAELLHFSQKIL